jgi:prepilin-type processing-associated H-X9-DG protein
MRRQTGLTRIDVVVAFACVALILAQAAVLNAGGRERSKREVCLANLRMLTAAWKAYADDNGGKLVNGGQAPQPTGTAIARAEPLWCSSFNTPADPGYDWSWNGAFGEPVLNFEQRVEKLKKGALYKYCPDVTVFRCPEADKDMHRTYIMPTPMNAAWTTVAGGTTGVPGYPVNKVAKSTAQIARPNERIAFLEEKVVTPDAFEFPIDFPSNPLCDALSIVHGNGINFGFADGHAEYHQWECPSTIAWALGGNPPAGSDTCFRAKDQAWLRNAIWGE